MGKRLRLVFLSFSLFCSTAWAQIAPNNVAAQRGLPDTRVMFVDTATVDSLTTLTVRDDIDAISLDLTRATLMAHPAAMQALISWVSRGGVVYVHSDAAQIFGYRTVPPRAATARMAGQYFGRARASLPLGGHRLLWGNAIRPVRGPRSPEVRVVFYQMKAGDQLVVDHPAGVGLLSVTDLATPATTRPLFAAAAAPFGAGWALFTPFYIETHRADGAAFVQNLSRFAIEAGVTARHNLSNKVEDGDLVAVPGSLLDRAPGVGEAGASTWLRLLLPVSVATTGGDTAVIDATPRRHTEPVLLVTRRDVRALSYGLSPDADAPAQNAARALLAILRARLALQRNLPQRASEQVAIAAKLAPQSAETLWLQGALAVAYGEDLTQSSQTRANSYRSAAQSWDGALQGNSLSAWLVARDPARLPGVPQSTAATLVADVPRELVELWRDGIGYLGNQAAAEPPIAQTLGATGNATVMRYFANDPTLNLLRPTANLLSRGDTTVGWRADQQEVLLFPSYDYLRAYRTAAGAFPQQALLPDPWRGDASGSRILMLSEMPTDVLGVGGAPIMQQNPFIGGMVPDLTSTTLMARLHAYVLIDALAEGGTRVPLWMQLGLSGMVNAGTTSNIVAASRAAQATTMSLQTGGIFTPEQFTRAGIPISTLTGAEAQGLRLMVFFYYRFGAGRVAETLQRLGSGQSVDDALLATTGLNEAQFFATWQRAEFGR